MLQRNLSKGHIPFSQLASFSESLPQECVPLTSLDQRNPYGVLEQKFRMGNQTGKHEQLQPTSGEKSGTSTKAKGQAMKTDQPEENEVFAETDVTQNNGSPSQQKMVATGSKTAEGPDDASTAEPAVRPHLVRLFSRDAPGREDNTFKDRPSVSEELQAIHEDSSVPVVEPHLMEVQKLSSQSLSSSDKKGKEAKQMASASTSDHAKQAGAHSRQRDSGLLDQLGKFFGQEGSRKVPEKGKEPARGVLMAPTMHKAHHGAGRQSDDSAVVHFFKNMMSPKKAPKQQKGKFGASRAITKFIWGTEGQRPHYATTGSKSKAAYKGRRDGTLSSLFKMGKKGEGSPARR
ncbi:myelin basic protein-like [Hypanus sabinus]|uniref:myelin basic protein-like n=1 Tax=Hypanus sabinus TaxID=79690 RepID=UPI0028C49503|nr:myelin basic protein-like [Hypanus sabinus]